MAETERFATKKSLGQHFLTSDVVPKWMCDAADLHPRETVVEVGPGTGVLTHELLARNTDVIALEADRRALAVLEDTFPDAIRSGQLRLHLADIRDYDLGILNLVTGAYSVVANIPYYLTGRIIRTFLTTETQPRNIVLLIQKEVAKRVVATHAKGEKESLLSLSVQFYGTPRYVRDVSRGHFRPQPKVDSAIIHIDNISRKNASLVDEESFFELLHLGFGKKRKQLLGNLSEMYDRDHLTHTFSTLDLPHTTRADDLGLATWLTLTTALTQQAST